MEGYLVKRGHLRRNWLRRYCVMSTEADGSTVIAYYADARVGDGSLKGRVSVTGVSVIDLAGHPHAFQFETEKKGRFIVAAESEDERRLWVSAIHASIMRQFDAYQSR